LVCWRIWRTSCHWPISDHQKGEQDFLPIAFHWFPFATASRTPFSELALVQILVARPAPVPVPVSTLSCSVVIPARNEKGNVEGTVTRTPEMGRHTELIFVEGNSSDGTAEEIERIIAIHPDRDIKIFRQGRRRGGCGTEGICGATGDPHDPDADHRAAGGTPGIWLRWPAEGVINDPALYIRWKGRMVPELGNKFFCRAFTYLLDQRFTYTLYGTVLYRRLRADRSGEATWELTFGDFDLIWRRQSEE
jgi:hypothetical protein